MPRENKQRGRRADAQKRKHDDIDHDREPPKRRRVSDADDDDEQEQPWFPEHNDPSQDYPENSTENDPNERPFFGLLDEEEQEYFKRADDMLEVNQFKDPEERKLFLENLFKEADGKELKMACSQSCSRLMERLIKSASAKQLKTLFKKFSGQFLHLVQHRFASHCCETLFVQAAPAVSVELLEPSSSQDQDIEDGETVASMENLFLYSINELNGNLGFLATDKYGSHALRVLLLVLSGEPLDSTQYKSILQSRQKEQINIPGDDSEKSREVTLGRRAVPDSFITSLGKLITGTVKGLDNHFLQTLSTHKIGNPTLQLLLQLELSSMGKSRAKDPDSIVRRLLPDDPIVEGTASAQFANNLMYDPVGSRLLECILSNVPGKMFKTIYKNLWSHRVGSLSRNEIASYVVGRILERLAAEDLDVALHAIIPQIPSLVSRNRYTLIKTLVERCSIRGVNTAPLADKLRNLITDDAGTSISLPKLLQLPPDMLTSTNTNADASSTNPAPAKPPKAPVSTSPANNAAQRHASLLAQSLLSAAPPLCTLIFDSITNLPASTCEIIARDPIHSHVLQASLRTPHADLIFRRKLITRFYGRVSELALDASGSHLVDAIWDGGTIGMAFVRERLAEEFAENEKSLRDSPYGRKVWRNWHMDLYISNRDRWAKKMRKEVGNDGFQSFPGGVEGVEKAEFGPIPSGNLRRGRSNGNAGGVNLSKQDRAREGRAATLKDDAMAGATKDESAMQGKSRLQLARERYAAQAKATSGRGQGKKASTASSTGSATAAGNEENVTGTD